MIQCYRIGDRVRYIGKALPAYRGELGTVESECSPRPSNYFRVRFDNPIGEVCPFKGRKVHTGTVAWHALELVA